MNRTPRFREPRLGGGGLFVVGVAAVDHDVAAGEERCERVDRVVGRLAGRDHHPEDTRGIELRDEGLEGVRSLGTELRHRLAGFGPEVEADHFVALLDETARHVGAHLAETDHPNAHAISFVVVPKRAFT